MGSTNEERNGIFMKACITGEVDIVLSMIETKIDLNFKDEYGFTPLMRALSYRNSDICDLLIRAGCDVNITDTFTNSTVLMFAIGSHHLELANLILQKCDNVNVYDDNQWSALTYSIVYTCFGISKTLLDRGANINDVFKNDTFMDKAFQSSVIIDYLIGNPHLLTPENKAKWNSHRLKTIFV